MNIDVTKHSSSEPFRIFKKLDSGEKYSFIFYEAK